MNRLLEAWRNERYTTVYYTLIQTKILNIFEILVKQNNQDDTIQNYETCVVQKQIREIPTLQRIETIQKELLHILNIILQRSYRAASTRNALAEL